MLAKTLFQFKSLTFKKSVNLGRGIFWGTRAFHARLFSPSWAPKRSHKWARAHSRPRFHSLWKWALNVRLGGDLRPLALLDSYNFLCLTVSVRWDVMPGVVVYCVWLGYFPRLGGCTCIFKRGYKTKAKCRQLWVLMHIQRVPKKKLISNHSCL